MKPLNDTERRKAFSNFLTLFIITIAIIVTTVFFSILVPLKENKKLKAAFIENQNKQDFEKEFCVKLDEIEPLLDTLGQPDRSTDLIDANIISKIKELRHMADSASNGTDNIYQRAIHALADLESAKNSLASSGLQLKTQAALSEENEHLKGKLDEANQYIRTISIDNNVAPPYKSF